MCRLQESVNNIRYIIIDEYSMLGQVTFGWIDKRCKQATGYNDRVFGGKSLILTGDRGQLPPVADISLFIMLNHQTLLVNKVIKHIICLTKLLNSL